MLAWIQIYINISSLMNVLERKKLKSRKDGKIKLCINGVFFICRTFYVCNKDVQIKSILFQMVYLLWICD